MHVLHVVMIMTYNNIQFVRWTRIPVEITCIFVNALSWQQTLLYWITHFSSSSPHHCHAKSNCFHCYPHSSVQLVLAEPILLHRLGNGLWLCWHSLWGNDCKVFFLHAPVCVSLYPYMTMVMTCPICFMHALEAWSFAGWPSTGPCS